MLDGPDSLEGMRAALEQTPRLRALLARLVEDSDETERAPCSP